MVVTCRMHCLRQSRAVAKSARHLNPSSISSTISIRQVTKSSRPPSAPNRTTPRHPDNPPPKLNKGNWASPQRRKKPVEPEPDTSKPKQGAPTVSDIAQIYTGLDPRKKLYFALGLFAFSAFGVFATYKLEEWFPVQKPYEIPSSSKTSSETTESGEPVKPGYVPKSRIDLILLEEERLERLEREKASNKK
ncbi:hypothetical protein HDU97_002284 [Phlyctochytrium planicorne]|nr:hypothetical protein HDU97_002284 [Phlyctochytrium planicorne]